MNKFEANNKKALANAIYTQASSQVDSAINSLSTQWPNGAIALGLIKSCLGIRLAYKQEILNQFVEYMIANQNIFTEKCLSSEDFQDGLIVAVRHYFDLRSNEKRKLARNIFCDFAKSTEKPLYPLERYDDTLAKISNSGIRFLGMIDSALPSLLRDYAKKNLIDRSEPNDDESVSTWVKAHLDEQPLSRKVEIYILSHKKSEQAALREDIMLIADELEQLGMTRSPAAGEGGYAFTHYGEMFRTVVRP